MAATSDWRVQGTGNEIYERIFVPAMMEPWARRGLEVAAPEAGATLLDIACGTGIATRLAARAVGPRGKVVGTDLNPDMLEVARTVHAPTPEDAPIEWHMADAQALPFADASFDLALMQFGLMFVPDRTLALKEAARVLRPGGHIVLTAWGALDANPGQRAMKSAWLHHFGRDSIGMYERQHSLSAPGALTAFLASAGFESIDERRETGLTRLDSPEVLARSYGQMAGIVADDKSKQDVITEVTAELAEYANGGQLVCPNEVIVARARRGAVRTVDGAQSQAAI